MKVARRRVVWKEAVKAVLVNTIACTTAGSPSDMAAVLEWIMGRKPRFRVEDLVAAAEEVFRRVQHPWCPDDWLLEPLQPLGFRWVRRGSLRVAIVGPLALKFERRYHYRGESGWNSFVREESIYRAVSSVRADLLPRTFFYRNGDVAFVIQERVKLHQRAAYVPEAELCAYTKALQGAAAQVGLFIDDVTWRNVGRNNSGRLVLFDWEFVAPRPSSLTLSERLAKLKEARRSGRV